MKPATVVLGWAAFNAVLTAIMLIYGESLEFIALYAAAVLITIVVGLVVHVVARRPRGQRLRLPAGSRSAGFTALTAILVGVGFSFGSWLSYLAVFPFILAVYSFGRERLPAGTVPAATEVRSSPVVPRPRDEHPVLDRAARAATMAAAAARVFSALRPGRRS